jgi:hypothetical protein
VTNHAYLSRFRGYFDRIAIAYSPKGITPPWIFSVMRTSEMKREHKLQTSISGTVTAVFAHRFVIENEDGKHLADMGRDVAGLVGLQEGDEVKLKGERTPSEIKVTEIERGAGRPICIEHKEKHGHVERDKHQDPRDAIAALARQAFQVTGEPGRKPKHFEILGRSAKGSFTEFHVEFEERIRNHGPADIHAAKWRWWP